MSLLNKFFGDGNITDRYGNKVGNISHLDDHRALVYDQNYKIVGRIEEYGDSLDILDENNMLKARGKCYGTDDVLDIMGLNGNQVSRLEDHGDISYQTNRYDYSPSRIYNSDYSSSLGEEEPDGLGVEFWDNLDDDDI